MKCADDRQHNAVCAKQGEPLPLPQGAQVSCQQCCSQHAAQAVPLPRDPSTSYAGACLRPRCRMDLRSGMAMSSQSTTPCQQPQSASQSHEQALWTVPAFNLPDMGHRLVLYETQRRQLFETAEQQASRCNTNSTDTISHSAWTSAWAELRQTLQKL
ncbi:hypothetical protein DOTSEDRAFT_70298 [Dothistroma septosporum NZE10]|uniref:Uncharacterized protein n=1 Tax=Dothistroma septosporum (strain NZE10 / CBS 128990) TaxID=675120 RepID=N1PV18_DOTSN|nr:hypothetical protein DOTSEDRAFT_70298 [Dothistroma septosporum NZE10]